MGASLNQFFTILFWIIGILTVGFVVVFAFRLIADARNAMLRFRKRVLQPKR